MPLQGPPRELSHIGMGGGGIVPGVRGYLASYSIPFYNDFGNEYRLDYRVLWGLMIAGGLAAVVVHWLAGSRSGDVQPRSGDRV